MNATEFKTITGREPEGDDLDRANCPEAGTFGHWFCGVCKHGKPRFACHDYECRLELVKRDFPGGKAY